MTPDEIYTEGIRTQFRAGKQFQCKYGFIAFFKIPTEDFVFFSLERDALYYFKELMVNIGKLTDISFRPIFSPEEEVFDPYFFFVRLSVPFLMSAEGISKALEKAFTEFDSSQFESCVSSLGLIAEDHLVRVYETIFRDTAPKGQTLGQMFDQIHGRLKSMYNTKPVEPADLGVLFKDINLMLGRAKSENEPCIRDCFITLREIVKAIKCEREFYYSTFNELKNNDTMRSVFPKHLRNNILELIRYRNAASHKTQVPLGHYEALRTLYCLISFVMWWQTELDVIDWTLSQDQIIEYLIAKS